MPSDRDSRDALQSPRIDPTVYLAPSAAVSGDVVIGARASLWAGVVIRGDLAPISVGSETNLQENTIIHADPGYPCSIGRRVTVGHGAVLHGCQVDDEVLIGIGAVVLNGARVGSGSIVGAGAIVTEGAVVPPNTLAVGVPARFRPMEAADVSERIARSWRTYVRLGRQARERAQG